MSRELGRLGLILIQGELFREKIKIRVFDATRLPRNIRSATREILFAFYMELWPRTWQRSFLFSAGGLLLAWLQAICKSHPVAQQVGPKLTALQSCFSPSPPSSFWPDGITVKAGQLEALDPFFLGINRAKGRASCVLPELEASQWKGQQGSQELVLRYSRGRLNRR